MGRRVAQDYLIFLHANCDVNFSRIRIDAQPCSLLVLCGSGKTYLSPRSGTINTSISHASSMLWLRLAYLRRSSRRRQRGASKETQEKLDLILVRKFAHKWHPPRLMHVWVLGIDRNCENADSEINADAAKSERTYFMWRRLLQSHQKHTKFTWILHTKHS